MWSNLYFNQLNSDNIWKMTRGKFRVEVGDGRGGVIAGDVEI